MKPKKVYKCKHCKKYIEFFWSEILCYHCWKKLSDKEINKYYEKENKK